MSNEIYLYGLSSDGTRAKVSPTSIHVDRDYAENYNNVPAPLRGSWEYLRLCSLPEALSAPKMREALEACAARFDEDDAKDAPGLVAMVDAALAACGPGYTATVDAARALLEELDGYDPTDESQDGFFADWMQRRAALRSSK